MPYGGQGHIAERDGTVGVPVYIQDKVSRVLNLPMLDTRTVQTLAVNTVVNSYTVELTTGNTPTVGDILELTDESTGEFMQADIVGVTVGVTIEVALDTQVNNVYTTNETTVRTSSKDMLVDGSITPVVFRVLPLYNQEADITRVVIKIEGPDAMDFSSFGSDDSLTRGCLLRINNGNGTYTNIANFKSNGELGTVGYDVTFNAPSNQGNTTHGVLSRVTWAGNSKQGVAIRLRGSLGEALELVVQDDLINTNTKFNIVVQGHAI